MACEYGIENPTEMECYVCKSIHILKSFGIDTHDDEIRDFFLEQYRIGNHDVEKAFIDFIISYPEKVFKDEIN